MEIYLWWQHSSSLQVLLTACKARYNATGLTCARTYELHSAHAPVQLFFRQWPHSRHRDAHLLQETTQLCQMKSTCTKLQRLNSQSEGLYEFCTWDKFSIVTHMLDTMKAAGEQHKLAVKHRTTHRFLLCIGWTWCLALANLRSLITADVCRWLLLHLFGWGLDWIAWLDYNAQTDVMQEEKYAAACECNQMNVSLEFACLCVPTSVDV